MTLYIGLLDANDRTHSTVYLSSSSPEDWDEFERNACEWRHKDHRTTSDGNTYMPSDIAIGLLTNVLQVAGVKYTRIDL